MALSRVGLIANDAVSNAQIAPNTIIPEDMEDRSITSVKLAIPQSLPYSANVTGNASINRSLAVGYTDGRVPQANLDVKNNVFIGGQTSISGDVGIGLTGTPIGPLQIYHATTPRIFLTNSTSGSGSTMKVPCSIILVVIL